MTTPANRRRALLAIAPLCAALAGAACSGIFPAPFASDPAKASPSGDPSAAAAARPSFLPLGHLRWSRAGETAVVLAGGRILDHGILLGTLSADGTFTTADHKRTLVMAPDGSVHVTTGFDVSIGEDGAAVSHVHGQPDETITLEHVGRPRGGREGLTVEGLTPELRRTAIWILMIPDLLRLLAADAGE